MANRIVSVHAGIYGMGIYAIMLPSSGFSVAHCTTFSFGLQENPGFARGYSISVTHGVSVVGASGHSDLGNRGRLSR